MHNITLRLGTRQDVPEIMDIMTAAHRAMADPSAYITDEEEYVSAHVDGAGFILLGEVDGTAAGFFWYAFRGWERTIWAIIWISPESSSSARPSWILRQSGRNIRALD